jgi:hypothetical protein
VVIGGAGVALGGGADGCVDRVGSVADTTVDVGGVVIGAGAVEVSVGAVALATAGVIGAWGCCSPPRLGATTPVSPSSTAAPTHRPVW